MDNDRFLKLTAKQCDCLRLTGEGHSLKRAAQVLGITPYAVKERLRAARKILDIDDSWLAGREYLAWQERSANPVDVGAHPDLPPFPYTRWVGDREMLAEPQKSAFFPAAADMVASERHFEPATEMREARVRYELDHLSMRKLIWQSLFPPSGRRANDLGMSDRSLLIMLIVIGLGILTVLGYGIFISASRWLVEISQHGG